MVGEEAEKAKKQGFARAFTAGISGEGIGKSAARKHLTLAAGVILLLGVGAVAIGALTSHKSGGSGGSSASGGNTVLATPVGSTGSASARAGSAGTRLQVPAVTGPGGRPGPGGAGTGSQPWTPPGAQGPAPASFDRSAGSGGGTSGDSSSAAPPQSDAVLPSSATAPKNDVAKAGSSGSSSSSSSSSSPSSSSATVVVTGQVNCTSTDAVEGFWVAPANGPGGWANWENVGNGNADYWLTEPASVLQAGFKMSVGCGGSGSHWLTPTYTGTLHAVHNSFHCDDQRRTADYTICEPR